MDRLENLGLQINETQRSITATDIEIQRLEQSNVNTRALKIHLSSLKAKLNDLRKSYRANGV